MLKRLILVSIAFLFALGVSNKAYSEYKKIKVTASVESKKKKPGTDTKKIALEGAKRKALDKYMAEQDSQRVRLFNQYRDEFYNNIDLYVPEVTPLSDGKWETGYWKVNVEASINEAQIEELIHKHMDTNIKKKGNTYLSFVFVARESESSRTYFDKTTMRYAEGETYKDKKTSTTGERRHVYESVSGGSVETKNQATKYRGYNAEGVESKVTEVFNKANFEVVPPFDIGVETSYFVNDFSTGDDLSGRTKKHAVDNARSKGIDFFAIATLDVGEEGVDQATGMSKVYVRVNGHIMDLRDRFAKKISSVGPVQYSGTGENPKVAKTNALETAAAKAAKDLVDQLRVKEGLK